MMLTPSCSARNAAVSAALLLLCGAVLAGCGTRDTRAQLTGIVHLPDGTPLPGGTIKLDFGEKGIAAAGIDDSGAFAFSNLPTGSAKVAIETDTGPKKAAPVALPPANDEETRQAHARFREIYGELAAPKEEKPLIAVEEKFADPNTSGLTVELKPGENQQNFTVNRK